MMLPSLIKSNNCSFAVPVLPDAHYLTAGALALGFRSPLPDGRGFKSPNSQLAMSPLGNRLLTCTSVCALPVIPTQAPGVRPSKARWSLPVPGVDGLRSSWAGLCDSPFVS